MYIWTNNMCDALQQNRKQVTQAKFEIWTIEVGLGVKNNLTVKFDIYFFFLPYVFYHQHKKQTSKK